MNLIEKKLNNSIRGALVEFFLPLIKLANFFTYLSKSQVRNEELSAIIHSMEKKIDKNKVFSQNILEKINDISFKQEIFINDLKKDFLKLSKLVEEQKHYLNKLEKTSQGALVVEKDFNGCLLRTTNNKILSGDNIDSSVVSKGISELVKYCYNINPKYIIGLNRGGIMVGAYIALSMGVPSKNFLRCCVAEGKNGEVDIDCLFSDLSGDVVIVDSITRSGTTMDYAVSELKKLYPKITNISAISIFSATDESGQSLCRSLDYSVFTTTNKNISLPWTSSNYKLSGSQRANHIRNDFLKVNNKDIGLIVNEIYSVIDEGASK